ncbi:hypothetical protein Deipe_1159 [Deinococcus peraridilitoris DSM 19664]|uniref:Uncharacterized protein n=2 Tax=Deinococcus TaxID=1298 RepID=L0A0M6_DEIPD|nr:hypothetical protein Deipe_1159 [Deinococcus peraridilitoris DSM 19664]
MTITSTAAYENAQHYRFNGTLILEDQIYSFTGTATAQGGIFFKPQASFHYGDIGWQANIQQANSQVGTMSGKNKIGTAGMEGLNGSLTVNGTSYTLRAHLTQVAPEMKSP